MSATVEETSTKEVAKEEPSGPIRKRIYIGGLHPQTTEDQIVERFSKFGKVENVTIAKNVENECRGFGHMTIEAEPKKWEACLSVYNGAKWRGQVLKLEEAKMDWQERKRLREEKILEQAEKKRKRLLRWNDSEGFHAKDMTPVTDNNMGTRKGWKRGRYGRAIAVMRLKKEDGTKFVFEPTHYKNNLTKLYNIGVRMKPVNQLITSISDESSDDEDDWPSYTNKANMGDEDDEESGYDQSGNQEKSKAMTDDEKRKAAMEKMFEDQKTKKELISKALAGQADGLNHTKFDNAEDDDKFDDAFNMDLDDDEEEEKKQPIDAKKWMFDSDEDEDSDEELDIKINPVLEGEAGRKRLELQKKFKGDDRFKMGEDFIDEEEKIVKPKNLGDEITQELGAEKNQALDVLRAMFGDVKVDTKPKQQTNVWASSARFDPDADDSTKYLAEKANQDNVESNEEKANGDEDEDDDDNDFFSQPRKTTSEMPVVSTEKHFEVNTNLKPLFGGAEEAPFTLFGGGDSDDAANTSNKPLFGMSNHDDDNDFVSNAAPKKAEGRLGLGVLFFFHLDDPALMKKSCYSYDSEGVFQEKVDERDSYENRWRTQRPVIKEILKKRQKNAAKNQKRRSTRDLK